MLAKEKESRNSSGLLAAMSRVLEQPSFPLPAALTEQMKTSYLLYQLNRKLGPIETVPPSSPKPMAEFRAYGLYMDSPCPAVLCPNQHYALSFHVIDRSGFSCPDLSTQSFGISILSSLRISPRKWNNTLEKLLRGSTIVTGDRNKGIKFDLFCKSSYCWAAGGKVTLQVKCLSDERIQPLQLPEMEVIAMQSREN